MFTGIVEAIGRVEEITSEGTNKSFLISSTISDELKIDQSIAHDGVCLTVEEVANGSHKLTAIKETLDKSNLGKWKKGDLVNLERCMRVGDRLDGHIVQGHVDDTAICIKKEDQDGSWLFTFSFDEKHKTLLINKGSITVNGTSLTVVTCDDNTFQVAIIPYTYENTVFKNIEVNSVVNLEFDILGKYILKSFGAFEAKVN
jgi:riboflavin synthase